MDLLIVRHADAGDREEFANTGKPDHLRPLSKKGRGQMDRAAPALAKLCPRPGALLSSPYTRAVQTAEYVRNAYVPPLQIEETGALEPERPPADLQRVLRSHDANRMIVVGHEPHLGILASWFIWGSTDSHIELKKGAACLIRFESGPVKAAGTLRWLMDTKMLRAVAAH